MDDQEFHTRREAAMVKLENATAIIDGFVNGPEGSSVPTESGPIPTLATMRAQSEELGRLIVETMEDFANHIDQLPPQNIPE